MVWERSKGRTRDGNRNRKVIAVKKGDGCFGSETSVLNLQEILSCRAEASTDALKPLSYVVQQIL